MSILKTGAAIPPYPPVRIGGVTAIRAKKYPAESRGNKAPIGIEPMHKGFADLSLTAWVRRRTRDEYTNNTHLCPAQKRGLREKLP